MSSKREVDERKFCNKHAPALFDATTKVLRDLDVDADVSYWIVEEVVIHLWRDIERLYVVHHRKVHPTKVCSYAAFWVRKLKPISNAYRKADLPESPRERPPVVPEITDINEQVALHLSLALLRISVRDGKLRFPKISAAVALSKFDKVADEYLTSEVDAELSMGPRFEGMVYDMRFRTYGPHHLTQFLVQIVREVFRECTITATP